LKSPPDTLACCRVPKNYNRLRLAQHQKPKVRLNNVFVENLLAFQAGLYLGSQAKGLGPEAFCLQFDQQVDQTRDAQTIF